MNIRIEIKVFIRLTGLFILLMFWGAILYNWIFVSHFVLDGSSVVIIQLFILSLFPTSYLVSGIDHAVYFEGW